MNKTTVEFMITIKADEVTLRKVQLQFNSDLSNHAELTRRLSTMIKESLLTAGAANSIEVELQPAHIVKHHEGEGGLSQNFYQEADLISPSNGCEHLLELMNSGAEILCSD